MYKLGTRLCVMKITWAEMQLNPAGFINDRRGYNLVCGCVDMGSNPSLASLVLCIWYVILQKCSDYCIIYYWRIVTGLFFIFYM